MLKKSFQKFGTNAVRAAPDFVVRHEVLPFAVAFAIAGTFPLPEKKLEKQSIKTFFADRFLVAARESISNFNEAVTFDVKKALQLVANFYEMRYRVAFQTDISFLESGLEVVGALTGLTQILSREDYLSLNAHPQNLLALASIASEALKEPGSE